MRTLCLPVHLLEIELIPQISNNAAILVNEEIRSSGRSRGRIDPTNLQPRRHPGGRGNPWRISEAARVGAVNAEKQR